ncbi:MULTISPECIES: exodeoxyribonuclease V subunit alpha [Pseudoalteromonas]|uniref:RecBCD enzyme subunit RecD n=1 Tax=Pseudoalteromonas amylolytica TaxID=1859457 RepID=A0A1S1MW51_9GAMM|nr:MULTISPECIES: exodeoxyribonuclease V subunit alpha [Pseudoalteromonas]OHU87793.1 exodeoxyribonuclease V subunit alpha [Pseudoalteromonas sp. JW3]OHU91233.1 exodeoxyribonuclease V subunit alpha [Pseudoalteromonas amylolytica]
MSQLDLFEDATRHDFDHDAFINLLLQESRVRYADVALAKLLNKQTIDDVFYLILLLLRAEQLQHSCLAFDDIDWQDPFAMQAHYQLGNAAPWQEQVHHKIWQKLAQHQAVGVDKPLTLFAQKLYLSRLANYEALLAERFIAMQKQPLVIDENHLIRLLGEYFPDNSNDTIDWQKVACAMAATRRFCVLTGGPGTGKTTTVTKLLAILQSLYIKAPLTIKLVAPTGKAAARLSESILGAKVKLGLESQLSELIPEQAQTIHRLLGVIPQSNQYRHNQHNPLHLDLLIIDEASMVDLSLLAKLVEALPAHARLIMLGDKDQLASVDTGSVLSDLCQELRMGVLPHYSQALCDSLNRLCFAQQPKLLGQESDFALSDNVAFLQHSHRFDSQSGIGQLALAVNTNDRKLLTQTLQKGFEDIAIHPLNNEQYQDLISRAAQHYSHYLTLMQGGAAAQDIHQAFLQYQLLAALREGPYGVEQLNKRIEQVLHARGLIQPFARHYAGQPIMVVENDYQLKLFNGDIGILLKDEHMQLKATFIDEQGNLRSFYPARLPRHENVYAMTIHKSQGSEFANTAMILPPIQRSSVGINRQLLYTGITRAKQYFELVAQEQVLLNAMARSVSRCSGLRERLMKN